MGKSKKLTVKQERFCIEYLATGNASEASRRAGYADAGNGYRLLRKPEIAQRVDGLQAEALQHMHGNAERVLQELTRLAVANMADYIGPGGVLDINKLSRDQTAALVEYTETTSKAGTVTKRIKLGDKLGALDRLAKHFGIYEADNNQKAPAATKGDIDVTDLARRLAFLMADAAHNGQSPPAMIDAEPAETAPESLPNH